MIKQLLTERSKRYRRSQRIAKVKSKSNYNKRKGVAYLIVLYVRCRDWCQYQKANGLVRTKTDRRHYANARLRSLYLFRQIPQLERRKLTIQSIIDP